MYVSLSSVIMQQLLAPVCTAARLSICLSMRPMSASRRWLRLKF